MAGKEKLHVGSPKPVPRALKEKSIHPQAQIKRRTKRCGRTCGILGSGPSRSPERDAHAGDTVMSQLQATSAEVRSVEQSSWAGRAAAFLYGILAYLAFFVTVLYAIGFVGGILVPKAIDSGTAGSAGQAVLVDLLLLSLFAVQHSVMARKGFKLWWTRIIPKSIERSTYVLLSSLALALLLWQWQPLPAVVWQIDDVQLAMTVMAVSFLGWIIVFTSTFLINHFELFGLHQVANNLTGRPMPAPRFRAPFYYKLVRHPIYLGFIIAFWAAPTMTVGHLLFAAVTTAYIFVGIILEEHDLIAQFGDEYRRYRQRVAMIVPFVGKSS
jgi:protein-S-isoprenylcysteine O-methyltransferase Ste14